MTFSSTRSPPLGSFEGSRKAGSRWASRQIASKVRVVSQKPWQTEHSTTSVTSSERMRSSHPHRGQPRSAGSGVRAWGWIATPHPLQCRASSSRRVKHFGQTVPRLRSIAESFAPHHWQNASLPASFPSFNGPPQ